MKAVGTQVSKIHDTQFKAPQDNTNCQLLNQTISKTKYLRLVYHYTVSLLISQLQPIPKCIAHRWDRTDKLAHCFTHSLTVPALGVGDASEARS